MERRRERFCPRPLDGDRPYLWLDAKAIKVRHDGREVNMAAAVAVGVRVGGEVLSFDLGASETDL